jgi:uncharacterized phage protein gp47/JayE
MTLPVPDAVYPTPDEIRDSLLRAVRYEYLRLGIDRNTLPGSDDYFRIDKLAGRVGIAIANGEISNEDADPLTATGDPLKRLAAVFGVYGRPAAGSAGAATIGATATVTLPSGWTGTAPSGRKYVATPGTYAIGAAVSLQAISTGASTNQPAGTIITWDSAAIGALSPIAVVTAAGLTGGADADDDDALRTRLLQRLGAAAGGGDWPQVVQWAEDASASIEAAYEYSAAQGAASYDVAVTKRGGDRTLPLIIVQAVQAYVLARMPGQQQGTFTSVTAERVDVVLAASLPLPQLAGGAGGGWRDTVPWPAEDTKVTAYNTGTGVATVNATAAPSVGASIGVWDPTYVDPDDAAVTGRMLEYTVATVAGSAGAWTITAQNGFSISPLGAYVSAGAVSLVSYARTFADHVALLGPGEKTALPELLPRASRQPAPDVRAPAALTNRVPDAVIVAYPEILDLFYTKRVATGTTTARTAPSVPATSADPPHVLVLQHLAIRAA